MIMSEMVLSSPAFEQMEMIPKRYTCQGEDISPPLKIDQIPEEAKSLVLIMDDPDAPSGTWVHWVVWNIPPVDTIEEGELPNEALEGVNSWGNNEYGGPCPPSGTHRYFFKVYALDTTLNLSIDSEKKVVLKQIEEHIIFQTEIIGLYEKE